MQDNPMQAAMQPYVKLVQANMELLAKFSASPEVAAQAGASPQDLFQRGQELTMSLVQSNAFAQLAQGMLKNYTEFVSEAGQSGMALLAQGQAAMTQQVQEATDKASAATKGTKKG